MPRWSRSGSEDEPQTSPTEAFFADLARRGRDPLVRRADGTVQFELADGRATQYWLVGMSHGELTVSRGQGRADALLATERRVFDQMALGRLNAMAATLRGVLTLRGDLGLVITFERLFPGPPNQSGPRRAGR